ncbi:MAG: DUF1328 domain-containing protein [Pseudomonadota bacterium]
MLSRILMIAAVIWVVAGILGFGAGIAVDALEALFWVFLAIFALTLIWAVAKGRAVFR